MSANYPPPASQELAILISGPPFIGWCLQIFLSGICLQKALPQLLSTTLSPRLKRMLFLALSANLIVTGLCFYGVFFWGTRQRRDEQYLSSYTIPDACVPTFFAIVAFTVQSYFASRAYKVVNRSKTFLAYIGICMLACATGGIGYTVWAAMHKSWEGLFIWTMLYGGAGGLTDLSISIVLIVGLYRQKTGFDTPTDSIAFKLMRLSFQTASMTAVFTIAGAAVALGTVLYDSRNIFLAIIFPTPSIYLYSFLFSLGSLDAVREDMRQVNEIRPPTGVLRHITTREMNNTSKLSEQAAVVDFLPVQTFNIDLSPEEIQEHEEIQRARSQQASNVSNTDTPMPLASGSLPKEAV